MFKNYLSKFAMGVCLSLFSMAAYAQTVTGTVTSGEDGEPLPGVSIIIKGTSTGSTTDINGKYSINAPSSATLVYSYIGYTPQEMEVGNQSIINITLTPDMQSLDEVLVIGYGTQEKRDLTGSVSSVSSREITQVPNTNVATTLQGRAPGVTVTENSGRPGAAATVRIRGVGTVGNSDPLYVVDGQILNNTGSVEEPASGLNSINPNDIESIEILKDAAAAAIYGARAANGVVLITTKRGKDGKTKLSYNGSHGPQWIKDQMEWMTAEEWVGDEIRRAQAEGNVSPWEAEGDPSQFGEGINYWDKLWKTGYISNHNLSMSGGNENSQFLVSLGYLDNEGFILANSFKRYSIRLNTDHNIGKRFKIGQSLQATKNEIQNVGGTGSFNNLFQSGYRMAPTIVPERFPDGTWNGPTRPGEPVTFDTFSPNQRATEWDNLDKEWQVLGNVYAEMQIVEGLKFRSTFSGLFAYGDETNWAPQLVNAGVTGNATSLSRNTGVTTNWQLDNILTYTKTFGEHNISVLAGFTAQENRAEFLNSSIGDFLDESVQVINGGNPETLAGSGGISDWALNSYIGRLTYDFKDKYLLQANFRRDGSSRFGASNRWGTFPSFSVGWRISEEAFLQDIEAISDMKIRASWGQLGNDQIGLYPFAASINLNQRYTLGRDQNILPGAAPLVLANENIRWETSRQLDIGLDMGLFDNRLLVTIDYFDKVTSDILLQVPIPQSSGFQQAPFVNAAEVGNKGIELSTTYRKITGEFTYDINANIARITNEVLALGQGNRIISGTNAGDRIADVGTEVFAFFGYQADGLYQNQAEIDAVNALNPERDYDPGAQPGAIRFKDVDGDGLITDADRTVIGSPYPDITYGLNFSAQFKGFDLAIFAQGVIGNEIMLGRADNFMIQPGGRLRYNLDRWFQDGDTNDPMLWGIGGFGNASGGRDGRIGDYAIFDGSYMRFKNITLGYTLPQSVAQKIGAGRLRVYVSTKNMITFWNKPGYGIFYDPELGQEGEDFAYNLQVTPQPRTAVFGVNLDF